MQIIWRYVDVRHTGQNSVSCGFKAAAAPGLTQNQWTHQSGVSSTLQVVSRRALHAT
jgi:hypothetical protein